MKLDEKEHFCGLLCNNFKILHEQNWLTGASDRNKVMQKNNRVK